jgi:hypothetical protein
MIYKLCVNLDDVSVPCRLTNSRSEAGGNIMMGTLTDAYPTYNFELVSDGPTVELLDYDSDLYHDFRHQLIKPMKRKDVTPSKLFVIEGGLT